MGRLFVVFTYSIGLVLLLPQLAIAIVLAAVTFVGVRALWQTLTQLLF